MPGPRGLRLSIGDTVHLALPALASADRSGLAAVPVAFRDPRAPLMGLSKFAPPSAGVPGVHSRRFRSPEGCPEGRSGELPPGPSPEGLAVRRGAAFGPELPRSGLVPPLPFLPASAACSTWHFSGLLHPETDPGVRHVSGRGRPAWLASRSRRAAGAAWRLRSGLDRPRGLPGPARPRGPGAVPPEGGRRWSRRGEASAGLSASCLPRWRITLRSFSLAGSCTASPFPRGRTPTAASWPDESGSVATPWVVIGPSVRFTAACALSPLLAGRRDTRSAPRCSARDC
jgi:hypothetical protein